METLSFAFGVLAMVAVVLLTVVVVGVVKVYKQSNQINYLERGLSDVYRKMDEEIRVTHDIISQDRRELNQRINDLNSYVDSRIDKTINKKQLIKG